MLYQIAAPTERVLTLEEAKAQCRVEVDMTDDDTFLYSLMDAVEQAIDGGDGWLGRCLVSQTWEMRLGGFCEEKIRIPLPPLLEVESVKYYDQANVLQTLSASFYTVNGVGAKQPGCVELNYGYVWPVTYIRSEAVQVQFRAGYVDTAISPSGVVPAPIKQAMLLAVSEMYEDRSPIVVGTIVQSIPTVENLLSPYRIPFFA